MRLLRLLAVPFAAVLVAVASLACLLADVVYSDLHGGGR